MLSVASRQQKLLSGFAQYVMIGIGFGIESVSATGITG